jgi:hypothetical protein
LANRLARPRTPPRAMGPDAPPAAAGGGEPRASPPRPARRKRALGERGANAGAAEPAAPTPEPEAEAVAAPKRRAAAAPEPELELRVRWTSAGGTRRRAALPLRPIAGVADLRGLCRRLIAGAFPGGAEGPPLPRYLVDPAYRKYAPARDWVALPPDAASTRFALVVRGRGRAGRGAVLAARELGAAPDPARDLMVTVAEFDSEPAALAPGGERVSVSLVSFPTVCVRAAFLEAALAALDRGGE